MDPQLYPRLHPRLALPYISPTPTRLLVCLYLLLATIVSHTLSIRYLDSLPQLRVKVLLLGVLHHRRHQAALTRVQALLPQRAQVLPAQVQPRIPLPRYPHPRKSLNLS